MTFDPLNILLLAIALVVFWRLKSVLGTRTGTEKPPVDPFGAKKPDAPATQEPAGTVIRFPAGAPAPRPEADAELAEPVWKGYAEPGSELAAGLEQLAASDPDFNPRAFVEGAKTAYEMIIEGFAKGDKAQLKNLLSKEVFDDFAKAIDDRVAAGQKIESRFVVIEKAIIKTAAQSGRKASITMQFVSELITATYAKSGDVVDGDPREIREVTDIWTFERDVSSRDPNWKLVATQAPA